MFVASGQVHSIDSDAHLGINTVSDPKNLVCTTSDLEHVGNDPVHGHHHDVFAHFHDAEPCEPLDPDGLHPFCIASELNACNCLLFKEILCMGKIQDKWFNAMDKELKDLFKSRTFEFVSWDEVLKQGEDIVLTTWDFQKKCHPSGEVDQLKACMCVQGSEA